MGYHQGQDQDAANDFRTKSTGTPDAGPSHRLLQAFVGTWRVDDDKDSGIKATETYRWLDGEYFLEYRFERDFGGTKHVGLGVLGFDESQGKYVFRNFDNLGFFREYETTIEKGLMTLTGPTERATIGLNSAETHITIDWEQTKDGQTWDSICHMVGHRIH